MQRSRGDFGNGGLPDPFMDVTSAAMPESLTQVWRWCERLFERIGVYRSAVERILAYFITELQLDGKDRQEKRLVLDYMEDQLHYRSILMDTGLDLFFYGNSLTSVLPVNVRYLYCPRCRKIERPFREIQRNPLYNYQWRSFEFHARCPGCRYQGAWGSTMRKSVGVPLRLYRWPIHEMELMFDPWSEQCRYIWKLSPAYREQIRRGDPVVLEHAEPELIAAVKSNQWILLDDGVVYHMKERRLCGHENRGWGMSRALGHFGSTYSVQMLHRFNEASALDFVVPFRVITPELRGGPVEGEPALKLGISSFASRVGNMVRARRHDPTRWNVLPFPIRGHILGGDTATFTPRDLLDQGYDVMLNAIGAPVEFYKGTISAQGAPAMLRLFESFHSPLRDQWRGLLNHILAAVTVDKSWQAVTGRLLPPTHADDLLRQQMRLQMGLNQALSQTTTLRAIGEDFEEEERRKLEEQQFVAELQGEKQKEMDQSMAGDELIQPLGAQTLLQQQQMEAQGQQPGMPPGGAPAGPPAGVAGGMGMGSPQMGMPQRPDEYQAMADQTAQQLLFMDETSRRSALAKMRQQDDTFATLVQKSVERQRYQMRMQGGQMLMQQQGGAV